jgi:Endonuclease/Exonuclease/phosphatase family
VTWGRIILMLAALAAASAAPADTVRVAVYDVGLGRDGPGVLLHDLADPDPQIAAVVEVIQAARPDVLLLAGFDHDLRGRALAAFRVLLGQGVDGIDYPHAFAPAVNAGVPSGFDLDGDGLRAGPNDALGWGRYPGHGGMALVSRLPIDAEAARTFRTFRWEELPEALLPVKADGSAFPSAEARAALPLSSRAHWDVPVLLPGGGRLHVLAAGPTPPLFDGPEGLNRRRNHDEIVFWTRYLDGAELADDQGRVAGPPPGPLVVVGNLNADPFDGAGLHDGIGALLAHPRLRDPHPASAGGAAAVRQGGANVHQAGPPALDTADWRDDGGPGNLRVDYVLPSADLQVARAGVFWPGPGEPMAGAAAAASSHRLVWADVEVGGAALTASAGRPAP